MLGSRVVLGGFNGGVWRMEMDMMELGDDDTPSVVPALCIVYSTLLFLSRRCTAATSLETEAEGVPMGMRQKSDVSFDSVSIQWCVYRSVKLIDVSFGPFVLRDDGIIHLVPVLLESFTTHQ